MRQRKPPNVARQTGRDETEARAHTAQKQRHMHARAVGPAAHEQATDTKADHHQGVGQRSIGPADAKLGLHSRQHHGHHVHAGAPQGHQGQRDQQTPCSVSGVDQVFGGGGG
jgi:hypothetical protein